MMIQNGPEPIFHPVTGQRIRPYEFYEGAAHVEHENNEDTTSETKQTRVKKKQNEVG